MTASTQSRRRSRWPRRASATRPAPLGSEQRAEGVRVGAEVRLGVRRGLVLGERERPARARVVRVARQNVRVQVRERIAEQLVVKLDRLQMRFEGAADREDL